MSSAGSGAPVAPVNANVMTVCTQLLVADETAEPPPVRHVCNQTRYDRLEITRKTEPSCQWSHLNASLAFDDRVPLEVFQTTAEATADPEHTRPSIHILSGLGIRWTELLG